MKRNYFLLLATVFLLACYSEGPLTPTDMESLPSRFVFPQGNTLADEKFERIYRRANTRVIHRDFTSMDINRSWLAPPTGGVDPFIWNHFSSPAELNAAAAMLYYKTFALLPDNIMRAGLQGISYVYLTDNLYETFPLFPVPDADHPMHPVRAIDARTIGLRPNAPLDNFTHQVFFPLRLVVEIFNTAFYRGYLSLPDSWFTDIGDARSVDMVSYARAAREPANFENFWARQGMLPSVILRTGRISLGRATGMSTPAEIPPLVGRYREIPYFFMYLSLDVNWRDHFLPGGVFYNCPRLYRRLNVFYDTMKGYGIDFSEIQRILFEGTTVDTSIDRIFVREVTPDDNDINTYLYFDSRSQP
jgi:hypothetical protein